jgi:hypothetical protein
VRAAAQQRALKKVDPALVALAELLASDVKPEVRLRAAKEVLDRAGITAESFARSTTGSDVDPQVRDAIEEIKRQLGGGSRETSIGDEFHGSRGDVPIQTESVPGEGEE